MNTYEDVRPVSVAHAFGILGNIVLMEIGSSLFAIENSGIPGIAFVGRHACRAYWAGVDACCGRRAV